MNNGTSIRSENKKKRYLQKKLLSALKLRIQSIRLMSWSIAKFMLHKIHRKVVKWLNVNALNKILEYENTVQTIRCRF